MYNSVEKYLDALKKEMDGIDKATVQDALSDAEEHLRTALETALETASKTALENQPRNECRRGPPCHYRAVRHP